MDEQKEMESSIEDSVKYILIYDTIPVGVTDTFILAACALQEKKIVEVSVMTVSRCGILCSGCGYKEQMECKDCVHIDKPF